MDRIRSKLPQLEFCCCGCSLRAGSLIIGWVSLIGNVLFFLYFMAFVVLVSSAKDGTEISKHKDILLESKLESAVVIVISLLSSITSFILLIGIHKGKSKYLVPFLVLLTLTVLIETISYIIFFFTVIYNLSQSIPISTAIFEKIIPLLDNFLNVYFILVINSYYNVLKQSTNYARNQI